MNYNNKIFEEKQVNFKTGFQRAVDGEITAVMIKLNGSWRFGVK